MDKTLKALFDYQKFEGNADLKKVIDSVHSRYASRELSMDEMEQVSAAGTPYLTQKKEKEEPFGKRP